MKMKLSKKEISDFLSKNNYWEEISKREKCVSIANEELSELFNEYPVISILLPFKFI